MGRERGGQERYRECVMGRSNQWVPPEQIGAMTSSYGKQQGVGWREVGGRKRERKSERAKAETRAPTVTHSASRGPSTRMDKS